MSVLSENDCIQIIKTYYGKDYKYVHLKDFKLKSASETCVGFLGNHLKLTITVTTNKSHLHLPKIINAFVKASPTSKEHRRYTEELNAMKKEYNNHHHLLPSLIAISKKYNKKWTPDCYLLKEDLIVFEDLMHGGFRVIENKELMDHCHLKLAVETLSYMHASSILFERMSNKKIGIHFPDCIKENSFVDDPKNVRYSWFNNGISTIIKMVKLLARYSNVEAEIIESKLMSKKQEIKDAFKTSDTRCNVLCHGDLWADNFMFRYDDDNIPIECRLIDFQITRYAPNSLDLRGLLYMCSDKTTREEYEEMVIQSYEAAFNGMFIQSGSPIPQIDIRADTNHYKVPCLIEAILYEMITRLDPKFIQDTLSDANEFFYGDRSSVVLPVFERDEKYRNRLCELIVELVEDHLLN